jgi:hypothetical protein
MPLNRICFCLCLHHRLLNEKQEGKLVISPELHDCQDKRSLRNPAAHFYIFKRNRLLTNERGYVI